MKYPKSNLVHGVVFPNITAMMCGVYQVTKNGTAITVHYTDGATETCEWPDVGNLSDHSAFELVGTIQQKAREVNHAH